MSLTDFLTPKDTEEIKPNLFLQKKGKSYRQVNPIAWKGKMRWGPQMRTVFSFHTLFWFLILGTILYGYFEVNGDLLEFRELVVGDPISFCQEILLSLQEPGCTAEYEKHGLCLTSVGADFTKIEMINGTSNSLP